MIQSALEQRHFASCPRLRKNMTYTSFLQEQSMPDSENMLTHVFGTPTTDSAKYLKMSLPPTGVLTPTMESHYSISCRDAEI
jgi:hypothetical protein